MICSKREGFTLAELTVVCAIMGLIAMLCWPSVKHISQRLMERGESDRGLLEKYAAREEAARNGTALPHEP